MKIATMTPILGWTMSFNKRRIKKMVTIVLLAVLFFRPILRAVGLINEALNAGLDRAENKIKTEVK